MKTLHLSIILFASSILILINCNHVLAIPYFSPQELYKLSDMIFYGQVITKGPGPGPDYYYYQVKVATYFKNPQTSVTITIAGHKPDSPRVPYPQFEVGDNAIFYIRNTDGVNTIYWNSQKAGAACDVHSFLVSSPIASNPIIGPAPSSHIYIEDSNGNVPYIPLTNHTAVFHDDDVWNNYPEQRIVPIKLSIKNDDTGKLVFNKTQSLEMQACSGPGKVEWDFVPTQIANYVATVHDDKSRISMIFNSIYNAFASNSQFNLSPLKQFELGIKAENIRCNPSLILAMKLDYSPLCIKESSATKLFLRGWILGFSKYHPVYFMKPNSVAQISVKYYPYRYQEQSTSNSYVHLNPIIYDLKTNSGLAIGEFNATAKPGWISTNSDNMVIYTVTTGNITGVYWLSILDPCVVIPIAVNLDQSQLTISDLQNPADSKSCPAPDVNFHVVGLSNATLKLMHQ